MSSRCEQSKSDRAAAALLFRIITGAHQRQSFRSLNIYVMVGQRLNKNSCTVSVSGTRGIKYRHQQCSCPGAPRARGFKEQFITYKIVCPLVEIIRIFKKALNEINNQFSYET